jgi:hypothetical protein
MSGFMRCKHCNKKENKDWIVDVKGISHIVCGYTDCPSRLPPKPTTPVCGIIFKNPRGTKKFENFEYRAGYLMEKAQEERRAAEAASHMGVTRDFYNEIDDITPGNLFGEVQ